MSYECLKTLKDSEKQKMLVEKHMSGEIGVYQKLVELHHCYLPKI